MTRKKEKRDLFAEMMEGLREVNAHREGKITLRTHLLILDLPRLNKKKDSRKAWSK